MIGESREIGLAEQQIQTLGTIERRYGNSEVEKAIFNDVRAYFQFHFYQPQQNNLVEIYNLKSGNKLLVFRNSAGLTAPLRKYKLAQGTRAGSFGSVFCAEINYETWAQIKQDMEAWLRSRAVQLPEAKFLPPALSATPTSIVNNVQTYLAQKYDIEQCEINPVEHHLRFKGWISEPRKFSQDFPGHYAGGGGSSDSNVTLSEENWNKLVSEANAYVQQQAHKAIPLIPAPVIALTPTPTSYPAGGPALRAATSTSHTTKISRTAKHASTCPPRITCFCPRSYTSSFNRESRPTTKKRGSTIRRWKDNLYRSYSHT